MTSQLAFVGFLYVQDENVLMNRPQESDLDDNLLLQDENVLMNRPEESDFDDNLLCRVLFELFAKTFAPPLSLPGTKLK
jgi:hypothetical protein